MPIYEYKCPHCGCQFERLETFAAAKEVRCPRCGESAHRQLSTGTRFTMQRHGLEYCDRSSPCCGRDEPCDKGPCD